MGLAYIYSEFGTAFTEELKTPTKYMNGIGPVVSYDKRDDVYYPHHGSYSNGNWNSYPTFLGNDSVSNRIEIDHTNYFSSRQEKDVIAARFYGGFGIGSVPFEQQFVVGQEDIRGYSQGKYRGEQMVAIQGEYRWNFLERWSAVGFVGVATVFNTLGGENDGSFLPGIGTGFRYNVFEKSVFPSSALFNVVRRRNDLGSHFNRNCTAFWFRCKFLWYNTFGNRFCFDSVTT